LSNEFTPFHLGHDLIVAFTHELSNGFLTF